jgi:REP element-mobilizing transposase RayT
MTQYRRHFLPGGSHFFTVNLANRRLRLLTDPIEALRAAFRYTLDRHPFTLDAIVVLPEHLHAIWTLPHGDADFPTRWRVIGDRPRLLGVEETVLSNSCGNPITPGAIPHSHEQSLRI